MSLQPLWQNQLEQAKKASLSLRNLQSREKNKVLLTLANLIENNRNLILSANARDIVRLTGAETESFRDRLRLDSSRITQIILSLKEVAKQQDPVGEIIEKKKLKNKLSIQRVRAPLGVLLVIFESRPSVCIDAFSIAFKSGNVAILRGGKESRETVRVLLDLIHESLKICHQSELFALGVLDPDRDLLRSLLTAHKYIDAVIPRGGDRLIEFCIEHSKIPLIKNDRGLCHVYVHADAKLDMACAIIENSKTQRPGVCNSMETLLVHEKIAPRALKAIYKCLSPHQVHWFACDKSRVLLPSHSLVREASEVSYETEYLDQKLSCKVVSNLEQALEHIERFGSKHSECIVSNSKKTADEFLRKVDAAVAYWNASTRFTDGFELGLGAEIGISTQKIHVRGPIGLRELTTPRWLIQGKGQIRK